MRSRLSAGIVPAPHHPVHCPLGKCQLQITYAPEMAEKEAKVEFSVPPLRGPSS
jgi:hypothetical protein